MLSVVLSRIFTISERLLKYFPPFQFFLSVGYKLSLYTLTKAT